MRSSNSHPTPFHRSVAGAKTNFTISGNQTTRTTLSPERSYAAVITKCGVSTVAASTYQPSQLTSTFALATYEVRRLAANPRLIRQNYGFSPPWLVQVSISDSQFVTCQSVQPVPAGAAAAPLGLLQLQWGQRDSSCGVALRLRYYDPSPNAPLLAR